MVEFDTQLIDPYNVAGKLGKAGDKAPKIIAKAVNFSIGDVRDIVQKKVQETYAIKSSAFRKLWNKNKIKKAKPNDLTASIKIRSKRLSLADFILSPNKRPKQQPEYYTGKFLVKASMKNLIANNGNKGFYAKMPTGHTGIFYRISNSNASRKIAEMTAPSIPQMVGDEKNVYGIIEPKMFDIVQKNINKLIERELMK